MPKSFIKPPEGYRSLQCVGCGVTFTPRRHDQSICSKACREEMNNFEKARAQQIYRALYHWRLNGGRMGKVPGGASLGDISRQVQTWIDADKRQGRPIPAKPYNLR